MINRGDFQLFNSSATTSGTKNLTYSFEMTSCEGEKYHFHGYKIVNSGVTLNPFAFWRATSTLYVTIRKINGPIIGRGILNINPKDFISETRTLAPSGRTWFSKATSAASFLHYFAKQAARLIFVPFTELQYPMHTYRGFINPTPISETIQIVASDGVITYMQMWESTNPDPNLPVHDLFMIPGASVDHQIFSLNTINHNAVQFFNARGYRVWVITHRIGMTMHAAQHFTTFDARLDIRAALQHIRRVRGERKIYTIAHCMGSVAFSCGLLDGTIPADWIKGITCSQTFMNPEWSFLNIAKVESPIALDKAYKLLGGNWFSCTSSEDDSLLQRGIDQALRFYPCEPKEMCNNIACHRTSFIFGRCWNHANLNEATHSQMHRFFGGVSMTLLSLLMYQGFVGHVTTNEPLKLNLCTPQNIRRLKGIPFFLFSGADNKVLRPECTDKTYTILRDMFGAENYERRVVQGYGHLDCWMGWRACIDVYPMVAERVDGVCRAGERRRE
jgi:hypothetical protein